MSDKLFGSRTRAKVLTVVFLEEDKIYAGQVVSKTGLDVGNVQRELKKLESWGILTSFKKDNRKYYQVNFENRVNVALSALIHSIENEEEYVVVGEEGNMNLLTTSYNIEGLGKVNLAAKVGILEEVQNLDSFYTLKDKHMQFWWRGKAYQREGERIRDKILKGRIDVKKAYCDTVAAGKRLFAMGEKIQRKFFKLTEKEVIEYLESFQKEMDLIITYAYLGVIDLRYFTLSKYIENYLKKVSRKDKYPVGVLMEKLLAPELLTYTQKLRIDFLKLAINQKLKKRMNWKRGLERIAYDYAWINFGWSGPGLSFDYFLNTFLELKNKKISVLKKELKELESMDKKVLKEKVKLFRELKIDRKHQKFIQAVSLISWIKVYRKDVVFLLNWLTFKMLEKFRRENNLSLDELSLITRKEAVEMVGGKLRVTKIMTRERMKGCVYDARTLKVYSGKAMKEYLGKRKMEKEKEVEKGIKILEGTTACLGKTGDWIYGVVKIVNNEEETRKVEDGDILVSVATTPEILPAMRRAGAIVTDHGGITCHAAIVSRELNKVCLIGTKYATRVFKDGDRVVVCPRHGYIRFQ
jgi:phosphoenolpyruvate synthase/pyruvate phosphate dikinase